MRLLLDTFVVILALRDPDLLAPDAYAALADPRHEVWFSPASVWEIEIKAALGKLTPPADDVAGALQQMGVIELPIVSRHAQLAGRLPLHHKDPFDRILIAQALEEEMTVLTPDALFARYGVPVLSA